MSESIPRWAEIVAHAVKVDREELHTSLPGRVRSYNATAKTATIELQVKRISRKRDGSRVAKSFPLLPNVPVGQPAGGGYFVHMPVAAGDFVWVMFSERSFDSYRGKARVTEPADQRLHDLSFGYALPVYDVSGPPSDAVANALVLGRVGGKHIVVDSTGVKLGASTAAQAIPLGTIQRTELEKILAFITAIDGTLNVPINEPGSGAPSAFQAALIAATSALTLPTNLANTVSTKHKIDE
jgi:hypothetical protein